MSTNRRFTIALVLMLTAVACAAPVAELTEEDRAAINATADRYLQALVDGDWVAYASVFAEDGVQLPNGGSVNRGRAAIQAFGESQTRDFISFRTANVTIAGRGDLAYRWFEDDLTWVPAEGGEPSTSYGKMLSVMKQQPDRSWLIVAHMWNSRPPPSGS